MHLEILTLERLELGRNRNGAFNQKQLNLFGVKLWESEDEWSERIIGRKFTNTAIEQFIELKDWVGKKPKTKQRPYEPRPVPAEPTLYQQFLHATRGI